MTCQLIPDKALPEPTPDALIAPHRPRLVAGCSEENLGEQGPLGHGLRRNRDARLAWTRLVLNSCYTLCTEYCNLNQQCHVAHVGGNLERS